MEMIPRKEPQIITHEQYADAELNKDFHFTGEDLWWSSDEAKRFLLMAISSVGLMGLSRMLPDESKQEFKDILCR
ncbi:hypothetical protein [Brevibacillus choshinensis]|uniref:Uncharacterized protein n=1 Tax=Brevibacillus choshinensis TaxID=54911 RepID=A0ABX7FJF0_BRECH|nr:hypothetical protein [Brevibacillus choshinensis]QRG65985.1 hypothetical protein JNE38_20725 [Brevibacillus choshinensis]